MTLSGIVAHFTGFKACLYSRYAETSIQDRKLFKTLVMRYTLRFKN